MFRVYFSINGLYGYESFLETTILADNLGFDCLTIEGSIFFFYLKPIGNLDGILMDQISLMLSLFLRWL